MNKEKQLKMTLNEFYKYCSPSAEIKVLSGFNGKVLCKKFKPLLHSEKYGNRKILNIWSEIAVKNDIFGNRAKPILVCYVDGFEEFKNNENKLKEKYK